MKILRNDKVKVLFTIKHKGKAFSVQDKMMVMIM